MMKTLGKVVGIMAVLHVVAALGFVGWLVATDRLDRARIDRVKEIFTMTLAEETAEEEALALAEAEAIKVTERVAALDEKAAGVGSADERVEDDRTQHELAMRKLERTRADVEALVRNLNLAQRKVQRDQAELAEKQAILDKRLKEIEQRANDEGFQKAIAMYESLPPKQVKGMFLQLIADGDSDQVVAYMESMEPRKAAKVLQEFKDPADLKRATELTERLRQRGSHLVSDAATGASG